MANKRITALPVVTAPTAGDKIMLDGATSRAITYENFFLATGGPRTVLAGNTNFYVRTDGSDSNNGLANTAGGAFLTLQGAHDAIYNHYDLAGFIATVNIGAGTYAAGLAVYGPPAVGTPPSTLNGIQFLGNTATPSNVVVSTAGLCVLATYGGSLVISGVKFVSAGSGLIYASGNGKIQIPGKVDFGACSDYQVHANVSGTIVISSTAYNVSGGGLIHAYAEKSGVLEINSTSVVTSNTPNFVLGWGGASGGYLYHTGCTFTGTGATGPRYAGVRNGIVDTGGGGASYFPGNSAGSVASGAIYV